MRTTQFVNPRYLTYRRRVRWAIGVSALTSLLFPSSPQKPPGSTEEYSVGNVSPWTSNGRCITKHPLICSRFSSDKRGLLGTGSRVYACKRAIGMMPSKGRGDPDPLSDTISIFTVSPHHANITVLEAPGLQGLWVRVCERRAGLLLIPVGSHILGATWFT